MEKVESCDKGTNVPAGPSAKSTFPSIDEEVVGFVEDAKIIMQKLIRGTKGLDVISIFGMAGLGKTTLARKVYNSFSIVSHFDVNVWCVVSETYNARKLLVEILKQTTHDKSEINEDDDDIADKVRKSLIGKRYLIVLDDMWKVEVWEDLRLYFPNDENGSRVMLTTRVEEVAKQLMHGSEPYALRFLTEKESWELLKRRIFQGENLCLPDLLEAGFQVAKHCKGLPLVIVLIAGIISKMERQTSLWLEVANDLSSHILGEQSMKAIQSSYDHLEGHLKPPLLYMAYYFPEDHNIPVSRLHEWWMAEEIVQNMPEETAKVCLNELVNRSLVMVSKRRDKNGDIASCMLHDVVREFCLRKLNENKFIQHILPYNLNQPLDYSKVPGRSCRYINENFLKYVHKEMEAHDQHIDESMEFVLPPNVSHPPDVVKLRHIRVLKLGKMESASSLVEALKWTNHLRYLQIYVEDNFDFEWVSHLCHLQVLRVYSRGQIRSSFSPFLKLTKLSHVYISRFSFKWEEREIENFNNSCGAPVLLENLKIFGTYCLTLVDVNLQFWNMFSNLEKFKIEIEGAEFQTVSYMPRLMDNVHLRSLKVFFSIKSLFIHRVRCNSFPFFLQFSLKDVHLVNVDLREDFLSSLSRLPSLEHLTLSFLYFGRGAWDMRDNKFPALKSLKLQHGMRLRDWRCSDETFPVLERLVIKCCRYLEQIPDSFADIPTLKLIKLIQCKEPLRKSALNIKEQLEVNTGCDSLQILISKN